MDTNDLVRLLPSGYEQACFEKKAITRKRTIKNPLDLLRLILFYLSGNKSLIDVSQFALISGIGKISDVGFMKRFVKCKNWIIWLTQHILPNPVIQYKKPEWLKPYQVLVIDASDIVEKGATGESLKNFTLAKGCLVIADRAYGTIKSIEHCLASGGDFIIRIKNKAFNIYDASGRKLVFADWLRTVGETAEGWNAYVRNSEKKLVPLRICTCKKNKSGNRCWKEAHQKDGKQKTNEAEWWNSVHAQLYVCDHFSASGNIRGGNSFLLPFALAGGTCI